MNKQQIPYKIYLEEHEMPKQWYNVRADMKKKPAPLLNSSTLEPMTAEELSQVFCDELVKQELDDTTAYFEIPKEILDFYGIDESCSSYSEVEYIEGHENTVALKMK